ncbi:hypothetical protein M1D55_11060 [Cupriavidus sp. JZ107]
MRSRRSWSRTIFIGRIITIIIDGTPRSGRDTGGDLPRRGLNESPEAIREIARAMRQRGQRLLYRPRHGAGHLLRQFGRLVQYEPRLHPESFRHCHHVLAPYLARPIFPTDRKSELA